MPDHVDEGLDDFPVVAEGEEDELAGIKLFAFIGVWGVKEAVEAVGEGEGKDFGLVEFEAKFGEGEDFGEGEVGFEGVFEGGEEGF